MVLETCQKSIEGTDLSMIEAAIKKDETGSISLVSYSTLENLITATFSSAPVLNKSFSLGLNKLSFSKPDIDYDGLATFYTLMISLKTNKPLKLILTTCLSLLMHPKISFEDPNNIKFLLIILENPVLQSSFVLSCSTDADCKDSIPLLASQVLERTICILAHTSKLCGHYFLNWTSRFSKQRFQQTVEMVNAVISQRMLQYYHIPKEKKRLEKYIEKLTTMHMSSRKYSNILKAQHMSHWGQNPPESLSGQPGSSNSSSKTENKNGKVKLALYSKDWKIASFAKVQAILFNANIITEKLPVSAFYNTMVDYIDIKADFLAWESLATQAPTNSIMSSDIANTAVSNTAMSNNIRMSHPIDQSQTKELSFSFCQYPFMLSIGQKTKILEYDAQRQMEYKAREAMMNAIKHKVVSHPYMHIKVRRSHILQDSFDYFESHQHELNKGIRIQFAGEAGIDVGGLRKEWFLLLMRELFDPSQRLFVEDEQSKYCWFDTSSDQPLKFYKLTGVALGLALYNSTILDLAFPPVLFKKLLGAQVSLKDFTRLWPRFGTSLKQLLDYDGDDFEEVFGLTFSVTKTSKESVPYEVELIEGGSNVIVTKSNRKVYVKKLVEYYLEKDVELAFQAMEMGFHQVFQNNAITLFQPCEIEQLVRGSDDSLDIAAFRSVTRYKQWAPFYSNVNKALVIRWFWRYFESLDSKEQRKLLMFITGSDRIPATGTATMSFTITRLGGDSDRFPVSHTCFNELCLYEYKTKSKLIEKLSRAVNESEGFGLK